VDASNNVIVGPTLNGSTIYTFKYDASNNITSTGTVTPNYDFNIDFLVVAGGGGGGRLWGGGGGGGGLRTSYGTTSGGGSAAETGVAGIQATAYSLTVGKGGTGRTGSSGSGANGDNSVFATITSLGGGGGGYSTTPGVAGNGGGSGGGGGNNAAGGAGTTDQGFAGGAGDGGSAGGGGGAGAVGQDGNGVNGSGGGAGLSTTISGGSAVVYAGGGAGLAESTTPKIGIAGSGGGGGIPDPGPVRAYADNIEPQGVVHTGGGGGGWDGTFGAGDGGSGIVILRIPSYTITYTFLPTWLYNPVDQSLSYDSGNVGIGTLNPAYCLDVQCTSGGRISQTRIFEASGTKTGPTNSINLTVNYTAAPQRLVCKFTGYVLDTNSLTRLQTTEFQFRIYSDGSTASAAMGTVMIINGGAAPFINSITVASASSTTTVITATLSANSTGNVEALGDMTVVQALGEISSAAWS
jgi:hypothetical protein